MSDTHLQSMNNRNKILAISTGGICLATAYVLSLIKIFQMPQGGSVTPASMLPIFLFALCFGPGWGIAVAFLFSLLQMIGSPYLLYPAQILLDYILAFSWLGVAGFFAIKKSKKTMQTNVLQMLAMIPIYRMIIAVLLGISGRFIFHVLSGVIFFSEYAPEGQNVWLYSISYNSFLLMESVITIMLFLAVITAMRINQK